MILVIIVVTTEIHYCIAASRHYGGKTNEIIIMIGFFTGSVQGSWQVLVPRFSAVTGRGGCLYSPADRASQ